MCSRGTVAREARSLDATLCERDDLRSSPAGAVEEITRSNSHAGCSVARQAPKLPAACTGTSAAKATSASLSAACEGLEIWVGRSDEGNDVLTTRLARGKDLFFHLDGAPGSHVILRTEGNATKRLRKSVLDACELAVHFSKQKKAGLGGCPRRAPIKFVKKPKGAKRGLVYVSGRQVDSLASGGRRVWNACLSARIRGLICSRPRCRAGARAHFLWDPVPNAIRRAGSTTRFADHRQHHSDRSRPMPRLSSPRDGRRGRECRSSSVVVSAL